MFNMAGGINWILSPLKNPLEFNGTSRIILFFTDLSQKAQSHYVLKDTVSLPDIASSVEAGGHQVWLGMV